MIERYFPPSEEMSLRIYGPNNRATNLNPGAVGGRLECSILDRARSRSSR